MAREDIYLNINASDPADAVVTAQQTLTSTDFPTLVLGDTPLFNFHFTDGTANWPSFAGDNTYSVTWALSDSIANDEPPYALQTASTSITGGWSIRLPVNTGMLINACASKRVSQAWPVVQLWQHVRVTDPSGYLVSYALIRTNVRLRAISDTQVTPDDPLPYGTQNVLADQAGALASPTNFTMAGTLALRAITNGAAIDALGAVASNGLLARTAADTYAARTITGTAGEITVTDGDGVAGNPTISLPSTITQATTFSSDLGALGFVATPATTAYSATTDIAMTTTLQTVTLTGNITFTTSGKSAGRYTTVRVICDASNRTLTFPGTWVWVGSVAPSTLIASKVGLLSLTCFGTTDADVIASWVSSL